MDNRYTMIKDLVTQTCNRLREMGISIDDSVIETMVQDFHSKDISIDQVKASVLSMEREQRTKHEVEMVLNNELTIARNLQNLPVQHKGITLHNQDIELMMIATCNNFEELAVVMDKINVGIIPEGFGNGDFVQYRQTLFDNYINNLTSKNDFFGNKDIEFSRKLEYLSRSGLVTNEEMAEVMRIAKEKKELGNDAIISELTTTFGSEKVHDMLLTIRDFTPVEKSGVKSTSVEYYRSLHTQIKYFHDSITLDEEGKYGKLILQDGTFDDRTLRKDLEYIKSLGKTARVNALMFYMDCPEEVYKLEEGHEATRIAREKLTFYVDEVTKVLADYPDVVRSVDVFNELLNRHPMVGDAPYMVRGDIPQNVDSDDFDNINAGWLKHLSVEDICEILVTARENLPKVDFMYNDDHLVDPNKLPATIELIRRIQDYSKGLGVQLIDSIGTQLHMDNNISKEELRNMFISLSEIGLPIEITEFDLAMTSNVEGLTDDEIETLRQHKINEIYEVINELKDKCDIRGFTVWSKTDSQNFRVSLANEDLIRDGREPITTLHGGAYTEYCLPKSSEISKRIRKQNFNYHGHTSRCGHASSAHESLYVLAAKNMGIKTIGFSDHVAFSPLEYWQQGKRMHISEVEGYITSIRKLQKNNPDMIIRCGFEAEYSPLKVGYLSELRDSSDYMILGQHYVQDGFGIVKSQDNPEYPLIYAESICKAMETGIYDILAHPDYFMLERDTCSTDEKRQLFMENAKKASYMICEKAREMGIPLELNARGMDYERGIDGEYKYPHSVFWNAAAEVGNEVLFGVDAHYPGHLMHIDDSREEIAAAIDISKLKLVSDDYDPVLAREKNERLQQAFAETRESSVTAETAMIEMLLNNFEIDGESELSEQFISNLDSWREQFAENAEAKIKKVDEKLETIERDVKISDTEKQQKRDKYALRKARIQETLEVRREAISRCKESVLEAKAIGCSSKEEYVEIIGVLTEAKTESNPMKIAAAGDRVEAFKQSKESSKGSDSLDGPKTLVYSDQSGNNNGNSGNDSNGGYASSINLLLVIGMLVMFGLILGFMIK
ncbi:MAG: endo-1,4-beta-xylanase [Bacilli bacterium]|nr:endo-1,4-beta-xylanase [Bacilli bacterium]